MIASRPNEPHHRSSEPAERKTESYRAYLEIPHAQVSRLLALLALLSGLLTFACHGADALDLAEGVQKVELVLLLKETNGTPKGGLPFGENQRNPTP